VLGSKESHVAPTDGIFQKLECRMKTAEDLRNAFSARYPDVDNNDFSIEHSGFAHEHPLTAIGVVLLASVVLRTTDVNKLVEFTRYSPRFVRAIANNADAANSVRRSLSESWKKPDLILRVQDL
jgi:hypothetical protein